MIYKCEASDTITRQIIFAEFILTVSAFVFPIITFIEYDKLFKLSIKI